MANNAFGGIARFNEFKAFCRGIVSGMSASTQISLVSFAGPPLAPPCSVDSELTNDTAALHAAIATTDSASGQHRGVAQVGPISP